MKSLSMIELEEMVKKGSRRRYPSVIVCKHAEPPSLASVQLWVGGKSAAFVEAVPMRYLIDGNPAQMFVDEEGLLKGLSENPIATLLSAAEGPIVGRAVILVGGAQMEGWR